MSEQNKERLIQLQAAGQTVEVDGLKKNWIAPRGRTDSKIMIVVSHPLKDDLMKGRLLSGDNGQELETALEVAGINPQSVWYTSVVKYGIGAKDKPKATDIAACEAALDEEIALLNPDIIVTLGAEAFKRIMRSNVKQSDYIGEIIDSPYGIKVLTNYTPGQVRMIDPTLRPEFREIFVLAAKAAANKLKYENYEYIIVDDPDVNRQIVKHYMDNNMWSVGYDAEWLGKYKVDEVMYTFQYSCEPGKAIILDISKDGITENLELLQTMKPLLEHPKCDRLGWNIRADDKRLEERGFKLSTETLGFDGMKACAFFDSRWSKGLDVGIRRFTNYPPYYNQLTKARKEHKVSSEEMSKIKFLEPSVFWYYCAGDAVAHREACLNMRKDMKATVPPHVYGFYKDVYLPLSDYLKDLESTGISVDTELMEDLTNKYQACFDTIQKRLHEKTSKLGFSTAEKEKAEREKNPEAENMFEDFNIYSSKHKSALFFDILKLEPAYYVKKGKAKPAAWYDKQSAIMKAQYKPSANGKALSTMKYLLTEQVEKDPDNTDLKNKLEIVSDSLSLARVGVFAKKFLSKKGVVEDDEVDDGEEPLKTSYWAAICKDGKIHADFFECLANFRSSSRVNVQNPASKVLTHMPAIFKSCGIEEPKNIRNIFYSGDPDWYWVEVDVAGADLAIAAFLSQDPEYIHDIRKGNFHLTKMREYFRDPTLTKDNASKYVTSKSITFRVAYTSGLMSAALPIQAEIFAESGNFVDIHTINYALQTWTRYKTYMLYRDNCVEQVKNEQKIVNARGIPYRFEETDNFAILAGWMNESLAYPIASELACFLWTISVEMRKQLIKDNIWMKWCKPVNTVHDASYWVIHKDLMQDNYFPEICRTFFTQDVKIATGDTLGMEMVVSDRWKGKEKIFSKETEWDFTNKKWVWKQ